MDKPKRATHQGELNIAEKELPCAVLEGGTRVLNLTSVFDAFDRPARSTVYSGNRAIKSLRMAPLYNSTAKNRWIYG